MFRRRGHRFADENMRQMKEANAEDEMRRMTVHSAMCAAAVIALMTGAAGAQSRCPEGRTAGGDCVNPALAGTMRQSAVIFSQPRLSETAFPVLP
jgi:hypothetical protein